MSKMAEAKQIFTGASSLFASFKQPKGQQQEGLGKEHFVEVRPRRFPQSFLKQEANRMSWSIGMGGKQRCLVFLRMSR